EKMESKPMLVLAQQKEIGKLSLASLKKTNSKQRSLRWHKRRNKRQNSHASLKNEDYRCLMNFSIEQTKKLPTLKNSQSCNSGRNTAANAVFSGAAGVRWKTLLCELLRKNYFSWLFMRTKIKSITTDLS
ncbi:hypothetical protein, partial [Endozoicomonas ascidiicola]|uniref:hypothetical protein n=1 Tax=Endozoicomonas ascidiicola TaxID=1698521 RepID=UPI001C129F8B